MDCVVIGGGPAGLSAAIYLARYRLSVTVFDDGTGRAATIPITHNYAGFPGGVSGAELLTRMGLQAMTYGAEIRYETVEALAREGDGFTVSYGDVNVLARTVLIATGVKNHRPDMPENLHDEAVHRGLIRYCPVCDGFEVTDKRVAVIGQGGKAFMEAVFLRSFTRHVTLLSPGYHDLAPEQLARLRELGIRVDTGTLDFKVEEDLICIRTLKNSPCFDAVYPALGSNVRSKLASSVGAKLSPEGCICVDDHQRTDVRGLYAAGDVVIGLDQISHAIGQAGVAATAIRNDLCEVSPLLR
ncbi:NAD(P)/FAD-dependent oxidoreductase [Pararhizobium arenae]|uniref:NAD(P)/FAD-dependent oxidoreductase n=1 Tax=Pararhizobium arenae TaxID=1856850 RepID=UPI00094AA57A|nr:NAD(P)/FAD-dependent oxidoreductase [Pararhizobium arenae]